MAIFVDSSRLTQLRALNPGKIFASLLLNLGLPVLGIVVFLLVWQMGAKQVHTSLGELPGPTQVYEQLINLKVEHAEERQREVEFYQRQRDRNARRLAEDPSVTPMPMRSYTGKPTFFDQIGTSLKTVMSGFLLASLVAIPMGIAIGLNAALYGAVNPLVQLFKPVSPLAWLPLVTIVVAALYTSPEPMFAKSYVVSVFTVMLCSLWPTLINTAVGVTSVSSDLNNVSKVLRLSWLSHVRRIVLPASVPMIFTGLRLSLSTAWMVLIAAEMLSQNPGLGKFVWDEFQNGSSQSLGRIMVAVLVIGLIGYVLDRCMLGLQRWVSWDKSATTR
jgi:nitrate/nitrite transport system permease protein